MQQNSLLFWKSQAASIVTTSRHGGRRTRPLHNHAGKTVRMDGKESPKWSAESEEALREVREVVKRRLHMSKKEKREVQGNIKRFVRMAGRPEFHHADKNNHDRYFEPTDSFEIVITSSKNNCWITVSNRSRGGKTCFQSHAGNVGIRGCEKRHQPATYRVAQNIARKCRRYGVTTVAEVRFRRLHKVNHCLQGFMAEGLKVCKLVHRPKIPKGPPNKAKKRRRV